MKQGNFLKTFWKGVYCENKFALESLNIIKQTKLILKRSCLIGSVWKKSFYHYLKN